MTLQRVVFPFTNQKLGGSHISAFTLGMQLRSVHGFEVLVTAPKGSEILTEAAVRGFRVDPLCETPTARKNPLAEVRVLPRRLAQLRAQPAGTIVHCNDMSALQSWGPAARLLHMPVVYHNRALNRPVLPNIAVLLIAQRILCISAAVMANVPRLLRARSEQIDNPFWIAPPADRLGVRQAFLTEWNIPTDATLVGFIGNFAHRKRPRFFLDMARVLLEQRPDAWFVFFGREVDEDEVALRDYAESLGIGARTIFAGFRMPVENNLAVLDVLAITALREPLGRTPIEALMLDVPYVASDDAGLAESGRRFGGGRLVPADASADTFAQAVFATLQSGSTGSVAARDHAIDQLSVQRHAERVLRVYNGLL